MGHMIEHSMNADRYVLNVNVWTLLYAFPIYVIQESS